MLDNFSNIKKKKKPNRIWKINKKKNPLRHLLEPGSRYASTNVLAAVPPGTPRAVSTEDITRWVEYSLSVLQNMLRCRFFFYKIILNPNLFHSLTENHAPSPYRRDRRVWALILSAARMVRVFMCLSSWLAVQRILAQNWSAVINCSVWITWIWRMPRTRKLHRHSRWVDPSLRSSWLYILILYYSRHLVALSHWLHNIGPRITIALRHAFRSWNSKRRLAQADLAHCCEPHKSDRSMYALSSIMIRIAMMVCHHVACPSSMATFCMWPMPPTTNGGRHDVCSVTMRTNRLVLCHQNDAGSARCVHVIAVSSSRDMRRQIII